MTEKLVQDAAGEQSWRQEERVVELPSGLSSLISNEVRQFVEDHRNEVSTAHIRWQDATLWMVVGMPLENNGGIVEARVTIGAYPGEKSFRPDLVFMADKMRTDPDRNRFIPPPEVRRERHIVLSTDSWDSANPVPFSSSVRENLAASWETAQAVSPEQISKLVV